MSGWLYPIFWLLNQIISLFLFVLVVRIVMSWLIAFQVVNLRNNFVRMVNDISYRVTEPVMRPIQRILPPLGGLDLSPIVIFLGAYVLQMYLAQIFRSLAPL